MRFLVRTPKSVWPPLHIKYVLWSHTTASVHMALATKQFQKKQMPVKCAPTSPKPKQGIYTDDPVLLGWCRSGGALELLPLAGSSPDSLFWRSWYSWKHGTIHRLVWHSGQWYLVLRRKIRPWSSIVFQQKLQPSAGPGRMTGQCCERLSVDSSRIG